MAAAADTVERSANASGTIVVPFPATAADSGTDTDADSTEGGTAADSTEISVDVSLPVVWPEDGKVICYVTFELNDAEILLHRPVEDVYKRQSLWWPPRALLPGLMRKGLIWRAMIPSVRYPSGLIRWVP